MKLNTTIKFSLLTLSVFCLWCASTVKGFVEPTQDNTMLVVGRVIVEDNGFTDKLAVYKKNIRVGIMGKSDQGKDSGYWTKTDENGYFFLADIPKGEYALKSIQLGVGYGESVTINNRLNGAGDGFLLTNKDNIIFNGIYFPYEPVNRIQCLKHNIFTLDVTNKRVMAVRFDTLAKLKEIKLHTGEQLDAETVEQYFIEKYPTSAWRSSLEASANADQSRRVE